jgi:hypothetical protein
MITICQIDLETAAFTGQTLEIAEDAACPMGWVRAAPPAAAPFGMLQVWSGETWIVFTPAAPDMTVLREAAIDNIAAQRWQATQTFSYDGVVAPADPALGAVVGFVVGAQISPPTGPATWKLATGEFRSWTVADVAAYGIAIRAHIQACFDREASLVGEVAAASTSAAVAAVVDQARTGWPA